MKFFVIFLLDKGQKSTEVSNSDDAPELSTDRDQNEPLQTS